MTQLCICFAFFFCSPIFSLCNASRSSCLLSLLVSFKLMYLLIRFSTSIFAHFTVSFWWWCSTADTVYFVYLRLISVVQNGSTARNACREPYDSRHKATFAYRYVFGVTLPQIYRNPFNQRATRGQGQQFLHVRSRDYGMSPPSSPLQHSTVNGKRCVVFLLACFCQVLNPD